MTSVADVSRAMYIGCFEKKAYDVGLVYASTVYLAFDILIRIGIRMVPDSHGSLLYAS
jgi:hypothetical protein